MANKREVVPGLSSDDVKIISDQIFKSTDENSPVRKKNKGFVDLFANAKPDISASSIFIKKMKA